MKKILAIAVMAAAVLTSCVKNEIVSPAGEINFKDFMVSTKALVLPGETGVANLPTTYTFGAFALYTGTYESVTDETAPDAIYVNDLEVAYKTSYWGFKEQPMYWPTNTADKLDFYAYYPYNKTVADWDKDNNCVKLTAAALGTTLGDQTDWMIAAKEVGRSSDNGEVPVAFRHITSMLVFNAYDATPDTRYQNLVTIKKIEVKQAAYTGDYTNNAWTANSRADVVVYDEATGVAVPLTTANVTTATSGALIVVPEDVQAATKFVVTYDIAESADHVYEAAAGKTVEIAVNGLNGTWEAGKKYVYTIKFDLVNGANEHLQEIIFEQPTVSPWVEEVVGAYDNI